MTLEDAIAITKPHNDKLVSSALLNRSGVLLMEAAGMLRMEAGEWRSRKKQQPKNFQQMTDNAWADKCERVAQINEAAATAMSETAKRIAEITTQSVA